MLAEFGTGNVVWLIALDSLVVTLLCTLFCIYDIIVSAYFISKYKEHGHFQSASLSAGGNITPLNETLTLSR